MPVLQGRGLEFRMKNTQRLQQREIGMKQTWSKVIDFKVFCKIPKRLLVFKYLCNLVPSVKKVTGGEKKGKSLA